MLMVLRYVFLLRCVAAIYFSIVVMNSKQAWYRSGNWYPVKCRMGRTQWNPSIPSRCLDNSCQSNN